MFITPYKTETLQDLICNMSLPSKYAGGGFKAEQNIIVKRKNSKLSGARIMFISSAYSINQPS